MLGNVATSCGSCVKWGTPAGDRTQCMTANLLWGESNETDCAVMEDREAFTGFKSNQTNVVRSVFSPSTVIQAGSEENVRPWNSTSHQYWPASCCWTDFTLDTRTQSQSRTTQNQLKPTQTSRNQSKASWNQQEPVDTSWKPAQTSWNQMEPAESEQNQLGLAGTS